MQLPPPGKELDKFAIEFKFSSTDTHSGPYTCVTHPTFFTNAINNQYWSPFTTIGTRNGYLFLHQENILMITRVQKFIIKIS